MSLDLLPRPRTGPTERINRRGSLESRGTGGPRRSVAAALVLSCLAVMALDSLGVLDGPRRVVGEVVGPAQGAAEAVVEPFLAIPGWLHSQESLVDRVSELEAQNEDLRAQLDGAGYDRNRLEQYDSLTATAAQLGYALVPARVIGMGPAQSFSHTVTIDAGSAAGLHPDQTVVSARGLVGRVLRVTRDTATVLLAVDADSVVGARIGESMEIGFLRGTGDISSSGALELELVDRQVVPAEDDSVVTWGSEGGAPYVAGIPVGRIVSVHDDIRDTTRRAVIEPFVDFSSLEVVGVVVPSGSDSDRALVEPDGSIR